MSMKWSFSADRCFRRCQRQYFFREIAACHNEAIYGEDEHELQDSGVLP
jgi:hypothetical protein